MLRPNVSKAKLGLLAPGSFPRGSSIGHRLLLWVGEAGRKLEGINSQTQVNNGIFPSIVTGHIKAFAQSIFYRDQVLVYLKDTGGMGRELR